MRICAGVAELADAPDLGSGGETREGSSPFARTIRALAAALCMVPRLCEVMCPPGGLYRTLDGGQVENQRRGS